MIDAKTDTSKMIEIHVYGTDSLDALQLAIWSAFDSYRETLPEDDPIWSLKYDPELGRGLAKDALRPLDNRIR